MQRTFLLAAAIVAFIGLPNPCQAQEADPYTETDLFADVPSNGNLTPEMWFYMQEYRRYMSPKEAVRRKAQMRSQQRQHRLASQRWFGISNLRPSASPVPQCGTYSPTWVGNSWNPYFWTGNGQSVVYHSGGSD